jgi:hypothetical protein
MKYGAVIVENRGIDVDGIINRHLKFLPDWKVIHINNPEIKTQNDYNNFLTSKEFYDLIPFDKFLIFQHDSGLLRKGIEDFLEWDYIGAPWKFQEHGGNGGLSWRSKKAMLECIMQLPWNPTLGHEDVYFSNLLRRIPNFKLAPREICEKFSCESIYTEGTLGYHAIDKYLTEKECIKIKTQYE